MSLLWRDSYTHKANTTPMRRDMTELTAAELGWEALGPGIAFTSLALVFLSLRWYTRLKLTCYVGFDDYIISLSMLFSLAMLGCMSYQLQHEIDVHDPANAHLRSDAATLVKVQLAWSALYHTTYTLTKISILAQYLHIFKSFPIVRRICFALLALVLIAFCFNFFSNFLLCTPLKKLWAYETPGKCLDLLTILKVSWCLNFVGDLAIWVLPMPVISGLHLPRREQSALVAVFLLGSLTWISATLRYSLTAHYAQQHDLPRLKISVITWSALEANTGIICACLLCIKPLMMKMFPRLLDSPRAAHGNMHLGNIRNTRLYADNSLDGSTANSQQVSTGSEIGKGTTGKNSPDRPSTAMTAVGEGSWRSSSEEHRGEDELQAQRENRANTL